MAFDHIRADPARALASIRREMDQPGWTVSERRRVLALCDAAESLDEAAVRRAVLAMRHATEALFRREPALKAAVAAHVDKARSA